jgi:hypothetical protein
MKVDLHVCTTCDVPHFDNCPTCWGFGVRYYDGPHGSIPISGENSVRHKALMYIDLDWKACPTCGSTPRGIPDEGPKP